MSDFDDLTPRYAHVHSGAEVEEWFAASGLVEVKVLRRPTAVRGHKPGARGLPAGRDHAEAQPL
jgi:hypothetical protein